MQIIPVTYFEAPHPLTIGQSFEGGLVGYVSGSFPNQKAIIVSLDWIGTKKWGTNGVDVVGTSEDLFTGVNNTNLIIASEPDFDSAAKLAKNYNGNGYNDWCLPSKADLEEICSNKQILIDNGANFIASYYSWSSSQYNTSYPWSANIREGAVCSTNIIIYTKNGTLGVRPVRYVQYSGNQQQI